MGAAASSSSSKKSPVVNEKTVCASAPGKVILFGEHAVVYGQPAVAAALSDLRVSVLITPLQQQKDDENPQLSTQKSSSPSKAGASIRIVMPDLPEPIDFSIRVQDVLDLPQLVAPPSPDCVTVIEKVLQQNAPQVSTRPKQQNPKLDDKNNNVAVERSILSETTVACLTPVIYLLHHLAPKKSIEGGMEIWVQSHDLPVGAGLGSSAAFGVAFTTALVQLAENYNYEEISNNNKERATKITVDSTTGPIAPDARQIERINQYAYYSESLLHGTPSGIDNAVSAHGGALVFTKQQDQRGTTNKNNSCSKITMEPLSIPPLPLILVFTHVPRSTKKLVANVRTLYESNPDVFQHILNCCGAIVKSFQDHVVRLGPSPTQSESKRGNENKNTDEESEEQEKILTLVRTNQHLLRAMGVSHPSLDYICQVVDRVAGSTTTNNNGKDGEQQQQQQRYRSKAAAKLTGAGGGGCAMILLRSDMSKDELQATRTEIERALTARPGPWTLDCFESRVAGDGALWIPVEEFRRRGNVGQYEGGKKET